VSAPLILNSGPFIGIRRIYVRCGAMVRPRYARKTMGRFVKGFTLIEVMITVAIVAILAAVALPNYSNYITRSRLVEATDALSAGHTRMEQHFQDNRGYDSAPVCATPSPLNTKGFTVTCPTAAGGAFQLLATGTGSMAGFTFT